MAEPQLEDGYTRVANEIFDNIIKTGLNGTQFRIVLAVWRYTYGFHQKERDMSVDFLAEVTGIHPVAIKRELKILFERRILVITQERRGSKPRVIAFNKDYEGWKSPEPAVTRDNKTPKKIRTDNPPFGTDKPKKPKQKRVYDENSTYYKMAAYFHGKVSEMAANIGFNHASIAKADLQKWADEFRKLVEIDGVSDKRVIFDLINWVTADPFWQVNVISAKKLREKFPDLALRMQSRRRPHNASPPPPQNTSMIDRLAAAQEWIEQGGDPYEFEPDI